MSAIFKKNNIVDASVVHPANEEVRAAAHEFHNVKGATYCSAALIGRSGFKATEKERKAELEKFFAKNPELDRLRVKIDSSTVHPASVEPVRKVKDLLIGPEDPQVAFLTGMNDGLKARIANLEAHAEFDHKVKSSYSKEVFDLRSERDRLIEKVAMIRANHNRELEILNRRINTLEKQFKANDVTPLPDIAKMEDNLNHHRLVINKMVRAHEVMTQEFQRVLEPLLPNETLEHALRNAPVELEDIEVEVVDDEEA